MKSIKEFAAVAICALLSVGISVFAVVFTLLLALLPFAVLAGGIALIVWAVKSVL